MRDGEGILPLGELSAKLTERVYSLWEITDTPNRLIWLVEGYAYGRWHACVTERVITNYELRITHLKKGGVYLIMSDKQLGLVKCFTGGRLKRINILEGSVRSGKTWISLVVWAMWVATMPEDGCFIMVAKTLTSLKRNILELLETLVGKDNFKFSISKKEGTLFGRKIFLEGASDSRSESKIRGMSLSGAYCDEITLINEDFFAMLLSRLSRENAKLIATTNPDSPYHWLKKKYLDRSDSLDLMTMKFLIDDNPFLPADYVKNLKSEYTGVFYDRYILGLWQVAEGLVYPEFAANKKYITENPDEEIIFASVGVDFGGNSSAHSFICTGFTKNFEKVIVLDEMYIHQKISPSELEKYFVSFIKACKRRWKVFEAFCDSAETTLIQGLENAAARARLGIDIRCAAKKKITERIRLCNMLISKNRFYICENCSHLIEAMSSAVWDPSKQEDVRLDNGTSDIDSLDAMEYSIEGYVNEIMRN